MQGLNVETGGTPVNTVLRVIEMFSAPYLK
jgi:hypothetical protein